MNTPAAIDKTKNALIGNERSVAIAQRLQPVLIGMTVPLCVLHWLMPAAQNWTSAAQLYVIGGLVLTVVLQLREGDARRFFVTYLLAVILTDSLLLTLATSAVAYKSILLGPQAVQIFFLTLVQTWLSGLLGLLSDCPLGLAFFLNLVCGFFLFPLFFVTFDIVTNRRLTNTRRLVWLVLHLVTVFMLMPWVAAVYTLRRFPLNNHVPLLPPP